MTSFFLKRTPKDNIQRPKNNTINPDKTGKKTVGKAKAFLGHIFPKKSPVYVFIDASNLFWGGKEAFGQNLDYRKLADLLKRQYKAQKIFYYSGLRIFNFPYSILDEKPLDLEALEKHLVQLKTEVNQEEIPLIDKSLSKIAFLRRLAEFGYDLKIKPGKVHYDEDDENQEHPILKANCDVDLTFDAMRLLPQYKAAVFMTGDGDFAPLLCYLKKLGREVTVISRRDRTAKEIRDIGGERFIDFMAILDKIKRQF